MGARGTKDTTGNHRESTKPGSWCLTETGPPARELAWDWPRLSEHTLQLCSLVFFWDSWHRRQGLHLILLPAHGTLSSFWVASSSINRRGGLCLATTWYPMPGRYTWKTWIFFIKERRKSRWWASWGWDLEMWREKGKTVMGLEKIINQ